VRGAKRSGSMRRKTGERSGWRPNFFVKLAENGRIWGMKSDLKRFKNGVVAY
jgi:hypothetical protein